MCSGKVYDVVTTAASCNTTHGIYRPKKRIVAANGNKNTSIGVYHMHLINIKPYRGTCQTL